MTASMHPACSTGRSTAKASYAMSNSSSPPRLNPATSSSWTISAATRATPSAPPSAGRRPAHLPATLQPRPQPDRAGVRQAQTSHAKGRRAHPRGHLAAHRNSAQSILQARMRQLPRQRRICVSLKSSCSRQLHAVFGLSVSDATVYRALKELGFSHVSARPKAYKQDPEAMAAFKKISPGAWRRSARNSRRAHR